MGTRSILGIVKYSYAQMRQGTVIEEGLKEALLWLKNDTSEDAVIATWWDLGYIIQSVANRGTVLDNGNYYPMWNEQFFRALVLQSNPSQLISFLRAHKAYFLLLTSHQTRQFQYILSHDPEYRKVPTDWFHESLFRKLMFSEEMIPSFQKIYEKRGTRFLIKIWRVHIEQVNNERFPKK